MSELFYPFFFFSVKLFKNHQWTAKILHQHMLQLLEIGYLENFRITRRGQLVQVCKSELEHKHLKQIFDATFAL